jgi:hypothetical protein
MKKMPNPKIVLLNRFKMRDETEPLAPAFSAILCGMGCKYLLGADRPKFS